MLAAERVAVGFVEIGAVAVNVGGGIYGTAQTVGRGLVLAGDVVACAVVGRCAHKWQAGGEVDSAIHRQGLEGCQSLVVVHG